MRELIRNILHSVEERLPGSSAFTVASYMIAGSRDRAVIDSLMRPSDMECFKGASFAIYTHADWDHCWGTPGLPGARVLTGEPVPMWQGLQSNNVKAMIMSLSLSDKNEVHQQ